MTPEVKRFRKRPVEIEAIHLDNKTSPDDAARWCGGHVAIPAGEHYTGGPLVVEIDTLEGVMAARKGDWIIRGVQGEFYPIKADILEQTYDEVREKEQAA
jgi:hypothetical protein